MPLDQHIEGRHGEGEARLKIPPGLMGLRQRFVLYPHIASPTIARRQHLLGVFTKP